MYLLFIKILSSFCVVGNDFHFLLQVRIGLYVCLPACQSVCMSVFFPCISTSVYRLPASPFLLSFSLCLFVCV